MRSLWMDILEGGTGPHRGDLIQSPGTLYLVLASRRVKRRDPSAVPRYQMHVIRHAEMEPKLVLQLIASAKRRGGPMEFDLKWYPRKKKQRASTTLTSEIAIRNTGRTDQAKNRNRSRMLPSSSKAC